MEPARTAPDPYDGKPTGLYWAEQLEASERWQRDWKATADKVVRRYRDERDFASRLRRRFNILWSNTQVLKPALYGRAAKPDVQRRYNDSDPVGRVASVMLERCIGYEVEHYTDFDAAMNGSVDDRLLVGRGISWVRYEPDIVQVPAEQITEDTEDPPNERVTGARCPVDYVHWQDFRHSPARIWDEVWWVARWVYMTREEGTERFGDAFVLVPCEYDATSDSAEKNRKKETSDKKAKVAEIWNKRTGTVCWIAKGYPHALDEQADPLELEGFFPCPRPLFATTTTDSLIPVPDYCEYQDQAEELDTLTQRISVVTKAIKTNGVYNAEFKSVKRLLTEGVDNTLEPVDNWAAFAEKGGLKGALDMLNTDPMVKALQELFIARDSVKQTIYEVTGISDVLRGATEAQETLGAQQLKASFGNLRLRASQGEVARFASDIFRLKAQIICRFYPPEVIAEMSGIMETDEGKDPQVVMAAMQMLKDSKIRHWRISVESDSLAQIDEQADKQARVEAISTIGTFLKDALPAAQAAPDLIPMIGAMATFLMRGFKVTKTLESTIERAMQGAAEAAKQAAMQPPPPDPKVQVEQIRAQSEQVKAGAEQQRTQAEMQMLPMEMQAKREEVQAKREQSQAAMAKTRLDMQAAVVKAKAAKMAVQ